MTEKRLSVRLSFVNGQQVKNELGAIGAAGDQAFSQLGRGAGNAGYQMQNAAYQVGDFFVQVAGGTDATRALAQQLPQLLGSFGLAGALAGAAVAAIAPFAGSLLDTGDRAEEAATALKQLSEATDTLRQMTEMSSAQIIERYGAITEELQLVLDKKRELAAFDAREAARGAIAGLADNGVVEAAAQLRELQKNIAKYQAMTPAEEQSLGIVKEDAILQANEAIGVITDNIGLTVDEVYRLSDALEAWTSADTLYEQADAASAVLAAISGTALETSEWGQNLADAALQLFATRDAAGDALIRMDEIRAAAAALLDVVPGSDWLRGAISSAADLAATLWDAARAKAAATDGRQPNMTYGSADWATNSLGFTVNGAELISLPSAPKPKGGGRRSGGRGGAGGADRERLELEREAARVIKETATDAERYADEIKRLNEMQAAGMITSEVYGRAVADLDAKYNEAGEAARFWESSMSDLRSGFLDAIVDGKDLGDVFEGLARSIAKASLEAAIFGTGPLASGGGLGALFGGGKSTSGGGGGLLSGLLGGLPIFDGGGHTGTGSRSGGLDGRGGFLAVMHPRERVLDETRGQDAMAGQLSIRLGAGLEAEWQGRATQNAVRVSQATAQRSARDLPRQMDAYNARGTAR